MGKQEVLVEAGAFADKGGWVLDQQSMDQLGSSYLLAHGLGVPVRDAVTTIQIPRPGPYRVWVRTRDWAPDRKSGGAPGQFQVVINGNPLGTTFGNRGANWHWQDGGTLQMGKGRVRLALRDLTGFEGRVASILLTNLLHTTPPGSGKRLESFRLKALGWKGRPKPGGSFDLVIAGGGIAGMCAAISAARFGLKTALIQDRPVLGGNNSSEVRVWLGGDTGQEPYARLGAVVREFEPRRRAHAGPGNTAEIYEDRKRFAIFRRERRITLFLNQRVIRAEKSGRAIRAVITGDIATGKRLRISAPLFADCTGDGTLGALGGAEFKMTRRGHMGPTNIWNVADTGSSAPFPRCPWALDLSKSRFPGRGNRRAQWSTRGLNSLGQWFWETGFNWDPIRDVERMRDWNLRAMYGAWDALKNTDGLYPSHRLNWAAYISGKRESRRLLGDIVLAGRDVSSGREFTDGSIPCTWSMDLHEPEPSYARGFRGREFISRAIMGEFRKPYWAPYRCLYSRNVGNLFMAGRNISVTHEALGTVRVMRTGGIMGEVVGMAASLCRKYRVSPREIYLRHLPELKGMLKKGVPARRG